MLILVYQYTPNWTWYLTGTVFAGVIYSFAIVPLFVAVGEVKFLNWNHGFTFLSFLTRAVIARSIIILCHNIQASYRGQTESATLFSPLPQPAAKPLPGGNDGNESEAEK